MKKYLAILFDQICVNNGYASSIETETINKIEIINTFYKRGNFEFIDHMEILVVESGENNTSAPKVIHYWSVLNGDFDDVNDLKPEDLNSKGLENDEYDD